MRKRAYGMPAVSGRYIVCPFCNSKKCKNECKSKKEGGISMYDKIYEIIQSADDFVWGWGMIALLLGTHLFLTVRTGLIQRKTITKGIRLSVAKEEGADGEVSQFGALATALASTIGTGSEQRSLWAVRELYSGAGSRAFSELQRSMPNRLLR